MMPTLAFRLSIFRRSSAARSGMGGRTSGASATAAADFNRPDLLPGLSLSTAICVLRYSAAQVSSAPFGVHTECGKPIFVQAPPPNQETAALRFLVESAETGRTGATTALSNSTATACLNIEIETRRRTLPGARRTTPE